MGKEFVTSDTHFCHTSILDWGGRPFDDIEEMDETLIRNWNSVVHKDDIVYHIGDVALAPFYCCQDIVSELHGKKILIMGNHDSHKTMSWWINVGFSEVYPTQYCHGKVIMQHRQPGEELLSSGLMTLFGHVHNSLDYETVTPRSLCACTDRWDFTPIELTYAIEQMRRRRLAS